MEPIEPIKDALVPVVVNLSERSLRHRPLVRGKIVDAVTSYQDDQKAHYPAPREVSVRSSSPYRCAHCKDAGYLRANVPFGHPKFGKAVKCECRLARDKEAHRQRLWEQSNIGRLVGYQEMSFESFEFWHPGVQKAYGAASSFANTPRSWLVLQGPNGCGKTHLAVAAAKQCLDNGQAVLFGRVPDLLDNLRNTFSHSSDESFEEEFCKIRDAEVLVLDDLGAESDSSWAAEKLYRLVDYRYCARSRTVITTNNINLAKIDSRISSRLGDVSFVHTVVMDGAQDFRKLKKAREV